MAVRPSKTFAIIKPDVVSSGKLGKVKEELMKAGFTIVIGQDAKFTPKLVETFYGHKKGDPSFGKLVNFMCSGPLYVMVLAKENAVNDWKELVGPEDSRVAKRSCPESLRAKYGSDDIRNAFHASEDSLSAAQEIRQFFPRIIMNPIPDAIEGNEYFIQNIRPALTKALTAICRLKPADDSVNAVAWLSDYLLENNPNKPKSSHPQTEEIFKDLAVTDEGEDDDVDFGTVALEDVAATKIQAQFRGNKARRASTESMEDVEVKTGRVSLKQLPEDP